MKEIFMSEKEERIVADVTADFKKDRKQDARWNSTGDSI